ncbi:hypothetical protein tb265_44050 [Gemmatimonadetes bacterium T265]|nr:hypothetical protein tb265_44050 [Gemmatimonadetes bacterium T265]
MRTLRYLACFCAWLLVGACNDATPTAPAATSTAPSPTALAADVGPAAGTTVSLVAAIGSNLCASVRDASQTAGAALVTATCTGAANQRFTVTSAGTLTLYSGTRCVDAWGATGQNGESVVIWTCHGGSNQKWTFTTAGTVTGYAGKCLDVQHVSTTPGARVQLYTCNGGANQRWTARAVATPPSPTTDTTWTSCAPAGASCDFVGLRAVRLGGPNGPYVQQTAYHGVPCATYAFGGQNPAPNQALHCDYGPIQTTTLANPMSSMNGFAPTLTIPLGAPGATGPQVTATSLTPAYVAGEGSFRTTCGMARFAFDDPIVFPGQPGASHLHMFFGNAGVSAASTAASLASTGNGTCLGGTLNRSAYWMPAVIDPATSTAQVPDLAVIYYKSGYDMNPAAIQPFPQGLRIITGNMKAASASDQPYGISWSCRSANGNNATASIPNCAAGDAIRLTIIFPQCWDGTNLDASDHKSHMAYPNYSNTAGQSRCPADHPVPLPEITEHFDFPVLAGAVPSRWRLSSDMYGTSLPGGYSAHADWMLGWDTTTMKTIVTQCLNKSVDCQVGMLGNGQTLY